MKTFTRLMEDLTRPEVVARGRSAGRYTFTVHRGLDATSSHETHGENVKDAHARFLRTNPSLKDHKLKFITRATGKAYPDGVEEVYHHQKHNLHDVLK